MKSGDYRITIESLQSGQPRPYADSIHEFVATTEWIPYANPPTTEFVPTQWGESTVLSTLKGICTSTKKTDKREWHESYIESIKNIAPGKWQIKVITPFTD